MIKTEFTTLTTFRAFQIAYYYMPSKEREIVSKHEIVVTLWKWMWECKYSVKRNSHKNPQEQS